ncbi:hypothetical protein WJX81_005840 [Elliptochloris bilobata]|uniref:DUF1664 domain-containing protein n=1 Tax=Elliptochloris bilobata TaxID=381761 RepID=A0AAW1S4W7_9CHLO
MRGGTVLGTLLGAGGATAYYNGVDVTGTVRNILLSPSSGNFPAWQQRAGGAGSGKELDSLYKLVEQLARDVQRQQGVTISMSHSRTGGTVVLYSLAAGGTLIIYLRFFCGWRLGDLMYVTRASLSRSLTSVTSGVEGLTQRLAGVKAYLQQQVEHLRAKQDATILAQEELKEAVGRVGSDVDDTRARVSEVHNCVRELEGNLEDISLNQQYANDGIYLLCRVVGDLMKGAGHRAASAVELDQYLRRPRSIGGRVQGLEGLLGESSAAATGRVAADGAGRIALAAARSQPCLPPFCGNGGGGSSAGSGGGGGSGGGSGGSLFGGNGGGVDTLAHLGRAPTA